MLKAYCAIILIFLMCHTRPAAADQPGSTKQQQNSDYTISVIPYYSPEKLWTKFAPFVDHLKKSTGKPWELKLYPNHDALIDAICKGDVSLALLGPVPLARSIEKCGVETVAVAIGNDGTPFYHSVIISSEPSQTSLLHLKNKSFGLFKGSTAAHIIPLKMLSMAGIDKAHISPVFFEGQDRIMTALLNGEISAAGVKDSLYKKFTDTRLHVLKSSDPLPNFAFAASPLLNNQTKSLFVKALLSLKPLTNSTDNILTQSWDDEIKNGFAAPSEAYRSSVHNLLSIYREIISAN